MSIFKDYARYYDLLNQQKNYHKEVKYIISLIKKYRPETKNIIELGCGTGSHATIFAEKGYKIFGIDKSNEMIKIANERRQSLPESIVQKLTYKNGDIRYFSTEKLFDVALSLFHVISYQITDKDINQSLETAAKHLKRDGIFIFDCWYGPAVIADKPYKRTKKFEDEKLLVNRKATPQLYPQDNRVDVHFDIDIIDKESGKTKCIEEIHKMRYLFKPEVIQFLSNNDFELVHTEEWLTGSEQGSNTWYVTFVCRRK